MTAQDGLTYTKNGRRYADISAVISMIESHTGLSRGRMETTGGNCAALRWEVGDGWHVLLTHGDSFNSDCDEQPYVEGWCVGLYDQSGACMGLFETPHSTENDLVACLDRGLAARDSVRPVSQSVQALEEGQ